MSGRDELVHYEARYFVLKSARHSGLPWHACFYCGDPADTLDHCPPLSRIPDYEAIGLLREFYVKVPSCRECNTLLGASLQGDIISREQKLKAKLRRRYARVLRLPDWSPSELRAMGRTMRDEIQRSIRLRERVQVRLDYSGGVNAWFDHLDL